MAQVDAVSSSHTLAPLPLASSATDAIADAGAAVCAFLIGRRVLSCARLANDLGTRPVVVEECISRGSSSRALRTQLSHYLQDHSAVAARLPSVLTQALQQAHTRDWVPRHTHASETDSGPTADVDEDILGMLDPSSRNHFLALESAVGQSFSSIMNDPVGSRAGTSGMGGATSSTDDWSGWLGGKLSSAFDYGSGNGPSNRAEEALQALRASYQTNDESSASLLSNHTLGGGFDDYVRAISAAYTANRKEGHPVVTSTETGWDQRGSDELPWPKNVPDSVFDRQYAPQSELLALPPLALPQASPAAASPPNSADETPVGPKILDRDTFLKDTERLETRSAQLRAWEADVERCLLAHVRSKSEAFFAASLQFTVLSGGAGEALACVRTSRQNGVAPAQTVVKRFLEVGVQHRRRQNYQAVAELVAKVQSVRGRLERVENWVALQERDMTELPSFVEYMLSLQSFIADQTQTTTPQAASPTASSDWMTRLTCLHDVPSRAAQVDKAMKELVVCTLVGHLTAASATSPTALAETALTQLCEAASTLSVFDRSIQAYQEQVMRGIWPLVQTAALNALMNTENALTDDAANELFNLSTGTAATPDEPDSVAVTSPPKPRKKGTTNAGAKPGPVAATSAADDPATRRKAFLDLIVTQVRFPVLLMVMSQLQEALSGYVTHVAQRLAAFFTLCLSPGSALAHPHGDSTRLRDLCVSLFTTMRGEMEHILAQMVTLREQRTMPADATEVENLTAVNYRWTLLVTEPIKTLEQMHAHELSGLCAAFVSSGKSPIRLACQKLCRHYLRTWHTQQVEKLTMVLDNETWEARDGINGLFQAHLGELCRSDPQAVKAFDALSLEALPTEAGPSSAASSPWSRRTTAAAPPSSTLNAHGAPTDAGGVNGNRRGAALDDDADDLLAAGTANRLFLVLDDDKDSGRVVCGAFLILIEQLYAYNEYVARFPSVAPEATTRMQELLALFDAKTASLVLGAKAVEKGTLRSISTQNLCVASQCVSLLSEFIPLLQQRLLNIFHVREVVGPDSSTSTSDAVKQAGTLRPFIERDMTRTIKDARAHRNECYQKIASLVKGKVESLGRVEPNGQWPQSGNEWVMTMLRETARLLRALKPFLPPLDVQGVVAPLLGFFAGQIREVTRVIPEKASDSRASAISDVLLFRANVEKFGYDVLLCAGTTSPATALRDVLAPQSTEQAILDWFFPKPQPSAATTPARTAPPASPPTPAPSGT